MSRLIDADVIYQWYRDSFDFKPNEVKFSMLDIRDNLENIPTADVPNMTGDLISRQDAIDAINAYLGLSAVSRTIQNMTSIQEILENLPSAEPRKKGKWIWLSSTYDRNPCEMRYMCSVCHHETILHSNGLSYPWENYCANCGADMRKGEEE